MNMNNRKQPEPPPRPTVTDDELAKTIEQLAVSMVQAHKVEDDISNNYTANFNQAAMVAQLAMEFIKVSLHTRSGLHIVDEETGKSNFSMGRAVCSEEDAAFKAACDFFYNAFSRKCLVPTLPTEKKKMSRGS